MSVLGILGCKMVSFAPAGQVWGGAHIPAVPMRSVVGGARSMPAFWDQHRCEVLLRSHAKAGA